MTHPVVRLLLLLVLVAAVIPVLPVQAQKFGYVDTEFILSKMPEYALAQTELAKLSDTWQREIEAQKKDLDQLYRTYQAEEVVLTEEMKKRRQDEIQRKKQDLEAYQAKQFGYEGQLFKKRVELNKPAQDKIFEAVEKVSKARKLNLMFDRSGDLTILYADPTHDYTEFVLEALGLGSVTRNAPGQKGPVRTVAPPNAPNATKPATAPNASADPAFETDSGTPDPAAAVRAGGRKATRAAKGKVDSPVGTPTPAAGAGEKP